MHAFRFACVALVILCLSLTVEAQQAETVNVSNTLSANDDSFIVRVRGMASMRIQTRDTYSGTWEVQCSLDGVTYDTDDEVDLFLDGASSAAVQAVTDTVGIWTANIAGCTHIKVIATAGFAATDTVVAVSAVPSGGSSGAAAAAAGSATLAEQEVQTALMEADAAGCTIGSSISVGAVLETEIKATAGQLFTLFITNLDATNVYARLYNLTAANADETDTPVARFLVPTGGGIQFSTPLGSAFSTAITLRVTTGAADTDTGVLSANEVFVTYCYQ